MNNKDLSDESSSESENKIIESKFEIPEIGDFKFGGVVFFIDNEKKYGFVSAIEDIDSNISWSNSNIFVDAKAKEIGAGSVNTDKIISVHGSNSKNSAAAATRAYRGGNYNDWFLPSEKELELMYSKKSIINTTAINNGGEKFNPNLYYNSSTEYNKSNRISVGFGAGLTGYGPKTKGDYGIRPIRTFYFNNENYSTKNEIDTDIKRKNKERTRLLEAENKRLREAEESRKRVAANKQKNDIKNEPKFITEKTNNGIYEGWSKNGLRNGKGKYTWNDGDVYEGDYLDSKRTGKGIYTYSDGDTYEGNFIEGKRTGKGTYTWSDDGTKYIGNWSNNIRTGRGKLLYTNGSFRVGQWDEENNRIIEDSYNITINRSNVQLSQQLENSRNKDLKYRVSVNGDYKTLITNYGFKNKGNIITVSPGDRVTIERNPLKRNKWFSSCTEFIVQEKKYKYSITCN